MGRRIWVMEYRKRGDKEWCAGHHETSLTRQETRDLARKCRELFTDSMDYRVRRYAPEQVN